MQQTAVEWLVKQLEGNILWADDKAEQVVKQAKEMEKQQQDKFSIDFFNWCTSQEAEDLMHDLVLVGEVDKNTTTKQLLEIYKNK